MNLPKAHKKFVIKQTSISILTNFVMNGLMTWLMFKSFDYVTLWDDNSIVIDICMTTFFFTFFTNFFVSKTSHKAIKTKVLPPIQLEELNKLFVKYPPKQFLGSLALAVVITLLISPLVIGILTLTDNSTLSVTSFVIFKSCYAGLLAIVITPFVSVISLYEADFINPTKK